MTSVSNIDEVKEHVDSLVTCLKRAEIEGSYDIAFKTVLVLRKAVGQLKWSSAKELMEFVRSAGKRLMEAQPSVDAVGNMVRRILKIIREEYATAVGKSEVGNMESLQDLVISDNKIDDFSSHVPMLKSIIVDAINELISELETSIDNIGRQALEHIHSNEVIMTMGESRTVEKFLKNAARKRNFSVIVAECAPHCHGQQLAKRLAENNIETIIITDAAIFAIMARVNKVIIGADTIMADGGLKVVNGGGALALAAKHHSVPFIVVGSLFKLSPQYVCSYDQDHINKFLSPHDVMDFAEGHVISKVSITNPVFDYVPPDLVNLYISDVGGNAPSYVYRLLSELYHPDDYVL